MILAKLKESTKDQHDRLETIVAVMDQLFTRDDYVRLLARFHRFYAAFEPQLPIGELQAAGFDYEPRRKAALLETDLKALGAEELLTLPAFTSLPDVSSVEKAFGALYVVEGSTLGGQVITRHLKEHLGLEIENGGTFFNSYGREVGPMWKAFGAAITAFAEGGEKDDEIVAAARETFDSIGRCMSEDLQVSSAVEAA